MKNKFFISLVILILGIAFIEVKFNIFTKVKTIISYDKKIFYTFYQIIRKEGIVETFYIVKNKLLYDVRLAGLGYSLKDQKTYPQVENAKSRESLPLYKVIKKIPTNEISESLKQNHQNGNWHRSHGGNSSTKYSILKQVNKSNVKDLKIAWQYKSLKEPKIKISVQANPIIVGDRMFVPTVDNHLLSLNGKTGDEIWKIKLPFLIARRGLTWEPNNDFSKSRLFVPTSKGVYAINAENGEILEEFGNDGQIGDQSSLIAPIVTKKNIIVALTKPAVEAYDKKTGQLVWSTSLIKKVKNALFTGSVPWGGMSFDEVRKRVYIVTGNPRPEILGTARKGTNDYSNSLIAINSDSGKIEWSFQEVRHGLWDFDIPSPPILTSIIKDSKQIDVVVAVTKIGNTILLDRTSGRPIHDARFKKAPTSKIPGEQTEAYQPDFNLPEMFLKSTFSKNDLTDISENQKKNVLLKIKSSNFGFFEPPVLNGSITLFGVGGGAQWTGASLNYDQSTIFIPSTQSPWQIMLNYIDLKSSERDFSNIKGHNLYQLNCASCHGAQRQGNYTSDGGFFSPTLVGVSFLKKQEELSSIENFKKKHEDILSSNNVKKITTKKLDSINKYISKIDHIINDENNFGISGFWRRLFDNKMCPGSKPPWLFLTALNLKTGKIIWRYNDPIKSYFNEDQTCKEIPQHGFTMSTAGKIVFSIFGNRIKAHDADNGDILWSYELDEKLSAPPSTYEIDEVQYITFVSSHTNNNITTFRLN